MLKNCSLVPVVFSRSFLCVALTFATSSAKLHANQVDETQVGAWYMFFSAKISLVVDLAFRVISSIALGTVVVT